MTRLTLLAAAAVVAVGSASRLTAAERKPNVLVIVGDDMGYADIGAHGCKDIPTPHIDSLARNGVRFTSGYVSGPYCSPTRAGLLTGRYQNRFGHEFNPGKSNRPGEVADPGLPLTETTMADRLKAAGYGTALVGKWHLGDDPHQHPQKRGFDEFFGFLGGAHPYLPGQGNRILRGTQPVKETAYLTDAFSREAVAYIDRSKDKPFFLYLAFNAVHGPMHAADRYLARFQHVKDEKRRTYCTMMAAMDDAIGAVLAKLRQHNLEENTLVYFFSDNGGPYAVNASVNLPLNGRKATTWEGGVRVPFLVQWKGAIPAGNVIDHPVIQLDVLPTALAAAGVEAKADAKFDGVNLLPLLQGKSDAPPHDALFWRFGGQTAVRKGDWKLVQPIGEKKMLFNLKDDLGEKTDLTAKRPDKAKELQAAWDGWNKGNVKPLWTASRRLAGESD